MHYSAQKGAVPLLLLIAVIGIISVLAVSTLAPFRNDLLSGLFPKQFSQAATGPTKWHPHTITFSGPSTSETANPNPFLNYKLQVKFTSPSGRVYDIPGFYDGDGNGGGTGNVWKVKFTPDEAGTWNYQASFRTGTNVAVDLSPTAGTPAGFFDGHAGSFTVADRDPNAPGFLKWGRLEYVGTNGGDSLGFHLKFRDGSYWIKGGVDSPENVLGYAGFDNTPNAKHTYSPHVSDWQVGNPVFNANSTDGGKGLIGAINYLASKNINSIYFLPMNIGGDGKDTWPFVNVVNWSGSTSNDNLRYDISKLKQWEEAFSYMQQKGLHLHFVLTEAEDLNKNELDNATLGNERKLFYRELVARFGHHNALQWNVSEEYNFQLDLGSDKVKQFAQYIKDVDPYDHPITVHQIGDPNVEWADFVGDSRFSLTSFQADPAKGAAVESWRNKTKAAGWPITVSYDEVLALNTTNADGHRRDILWPTYLSGGQIEWYVGSEDQSLENFRNYDAMWTYTWYARKFMEQIPFWQMSPNDSLLTGPTTKQVFAKPNDTYAVYLPNASNTGTLNLSGTSGIFKKRWYNPRTGNFEGSEISVNGGGPLALGIPPSDTSEDWVILINRTGVTSPSSSANPSPSPVPSPSPSAIPNPSVATGVEVFAIIGDSGSDEYRADDNRGGTYAATTFNWMEMLVRKRGFNFGVWSDTSRGEPRRRGYEYNFARSAARVADVINANQHTSVRDLVSLGKVTYVYIQVGANDVAEWNNTYQDIYNGVTSGTALTAKKDNMVSNYTTILDTVKSGGNAKIVISTMPDLNLDPSVVARYPDAAKRQRVTDFVAGVNTALKSAAGARNVPVFDTQAFFMSDIAPKTSGSNLMVGGQAIKMTTVGDEPHHMILGDKIHPGTVMGGFLANGILRTFNTNHQTTFRLFSEQEMLVEAGIASPVPSPSLSPSVAPSVSPKPGDADKDGDVDIFDYNILLTNFAKTGTGIQGDFDNNNKIDIFDYNILLTNFGK